MDYRKMRLAGRPLPLSRVSILGALGHFHVRHLFVLVLSGSKISCVLIALLAAANWTNAACGQHEAVVPVSRDGADWLERHESFNRRVKAGDVGMLLIGDSITHAWEDKEQAEIWNKHFAPRKAVNLGISGDRTQHVLWRLENGNIAGISPKLAVLMIGTNNSGTNSPDQIADGVTAIVKKLRADLPETKVLVLAIFPRGADKEDPRRKVNQTANERLAKLADNDKVHFLDIGPKFLAEDGTLSPEIMPDLLHLSPRGYTIWAESIEAKVAELMGEQ